MPSERKVNLACFFGRNEYSVSYILLSQEYPCSPNKGYTYQCDHIKKKKTQRKFGQISH